MHTGFPGRKQIYSYVQDIEGVWWKTVDHEVTEVSVSVIGLTGNLKKCFLGTWRNGFDWPSGSTFWIWSLHDILQSPPYRRTTPWTACLAKYILSEFIFQLYHVHCFFLKKNWFDICIGMCWRKQQELLGSCPSWTWDFFKDISRYWIRSLSNDPSPSQCCWAGEAAFSTEFMSNDLFVFFLKQKLFKYIKYRLLVLYMYI